MIKLQNVISLELREFKTLREAMEYKKSLGVFANRWTVI